MRKLTTALIIAASLAFIAPAIADTSGSAAGSGSAVAASVDSSGSGSGSAVVAPPAGSGSTVATVPSIPDPTAHPAEAAATAWQDLKAYGYVWGGMIVLLAIGTLMVKLADEEHWLSKGHTLPILVSLLGTIGALLQWHFAGGNLAVVFTTLMGAVLLIVQKPKPSTGTASTAGKAPAFATVTAAK